MNLIAKAGLLGSYLIVINILTFMIMGYDKYQARHDGWRVQEKTLWLFILTGGSLGGWLAMNFFHHKNKKCIFNIGILCCAVLQWGYLLYWFLLK